MPPEPEPVPPVSPPVSPPVPPPAVPPPAVPPESPVEGAGAGAGAAGSAGDRAAGVRGDGGTGARGADLGAALLESIGARGGLGVGLGRVELGLELGGVLTALRGEGDLLAGRDLRPHRGEELVQGRLVLRGRAELVDLVDDALAELGDLVGLAHALSGGRELLDRRVRLGARRIGLGDELGLGQPRRGLGRDRDQGLGAAVTAAGGDDESHADRGGGDEKLPQAPHTAGQGSRDARANYADSAASSSGGSTSLRCRSGFRCPLRPPHVSVWA